MRFPLQPIIRLLSIGCLALAPVPGLAAPTSAQPTAPAQSPGTQRLMQMFSPEIQATLNACTQRGGVNLTAGATAAGAIVCQDNEPEPAVNYDSYLSTVPDFLAASGLIGVRTAATGDPNVDLAAVSSFLSSPQGVSMLRSGLESVITQNGLVSSSSPESVAMLSDAVLGRLTTALQNPDLLATLVGTDEQYQQVVTSFCTAPGMSVAEAQAIVPSLRSIQLYAICLQESGLAEEIMRFAG